MTITRVMHRASRKYITIPDVFGITMPTYPSNNIICFRTRIGAFIVQYVDNRTNKPVFIRLSEKATLENFRRGNYKIRKPGDYNG